MDGRCLDMVKAFILACMSEVNSVGLLGPGGGRRPDIVGPSGPDVEFIVGAGTVSDFNEGGLGKVPSGVEDWEEGVEVSERRPSALLVGLDVAMSADDIERILSTLR